jgi:hypothetical protein
MRVLFALLAAIPVCTPAHAAPLAAIEGMTSTVFQRDQSSFSGVGLRVKIHPPQLVQDLTVVPLIEYWRNKSKLRTFAIESTRKDATLGAFMRYDFRREGWHPYAGAGIGVHFVSDEVEAPTVPLRGSDSLIQGGLLLLGGVSFGVNGNLGNLIEAEYHHLSEQSQFKINWGLSWQFGAAGAQTPSK